MLQLRIDPWTPDYESALQVDEEDEGQAPKVDPFVETAEWAPVAPEYRQRPESIVFIDGVQRVDIRVIGNNEGRLVYGAFCSIAVGAVLTSSESAHINVGHPHRILAMSDGENFHPVEVPCGNLILRFEPQPSGVSGLKGVHEAITNARREAERRLSEAMAREGHALVVVDGRLSVEPHGQTVPVGLVKTIHRRYLEGAQLAVLGRLPARTRTPLFLIERERPVYSWYVRLCESRPMDHEWAGLVRLEAPDVIGLQPAIQLADVTAQHLPSFASSPIRDRRAPQNLYPIGALEERLRRQLGDAEFIRRHILKHFAKLGDAA